MLERRRRDFVYICDDCSAELYTEQADFHGALLVMKEAGWRARKIDDRWIHQCIHCKTEVVK